MLEQKVVAEVSEEIIPFKPTNNGFLNRSKLEYAQDTIPFGKVVFDTRASQLQCPNVFF